MLRFANRMRERRGFVTYWIRQYFLFDASLESETGATIGELNRREGLAHYLLSIPSHLLRRLRGKRIEFEDIQE
jgi:hypothetical protein